MAKQSSIEFMMTFVQDYLEGNATRLDWDLDFNHYLMKHYCKMERENSDLAECFNFYLAEEGFDRGLGLSDDAHKKLIQRQFDKLNEAMRDGLC